jgi:hypothetical protein
MTTRLHQIIAIERGVASDAQRRLGEITHVMSVGGQQDPLTGISRTYRPRDADGVQLPDEFRKVQITAETLLAGVQDSLVRLFDLKFTREYANCSARADVVVGGTTLLTDVPAGYLLFLENQLSDLITRVIDKIPVLDPAEEWSTDKALPRGVRKTPPRETTRSEIARQVQVLYEATPEHPAQVTPYETQQVVGYWSQVKMSGQLPVSDVQAMRDRATTVLEAVKFAREAANTMEVTDRAAGAAVLGYIFGAAS